MPDPVWTSETYKLVKVLESRLRLQRHRNRNGMTNILSLLRCELREAASPEAVEALRTVFERIRTQVEIERLRELAEDGALPRADTMLRRFCQFIESGIEADIVIAAVTEDVDIKAGMVEPLLMFVSEAVTAACRSRAACAAAQRIEVALRRGEGASLCRLAVSDDRIVLNEVSSEDLPRVRLLQALALQLGARLMISREQPSGVCVSIDIPRRDVCVPAT